MRIVMQLLHLAFIFSTQLLVVLGLVALGMTTTAAGQEWKQTKIPVDAGDGQQWQLQEDVSDDFRYEFSPSPEAATIGGKWINHYRGHWEGPGTTKWRHENVAVTRSHLWIRATRVKGETKAFRFDKDQDGKAEELELPATRLGCITSVGTVQYPAYVEARVKVANAVLASNVWMLSADDTQEIDIIECYGGRGDDERADWFSQRIHMSHHVFIRKPFQDYQPSDKSTWYFRPKRRARRGEGYWTSRFLRVGVYWRDPAHLEYYLDGKLVKTTSGLDNSTLEETGDKNGNKKGAEKGGIDPLGYTKDETGERTGLVKPMNIIINMEAQDWNAAAGRTPTDDEIKRKKDHTFLVDWVRVYKPVAAESGG